METALDYFDQIYVINLPERNDRRLEMREQLLKHGLDLDVRNVKLFQAVRPDNAGAFPSIGARGCFLSHLSILQNAVTRGLNTILILEDDVNFSPKFALHLEKLIAGLRQNDWGIFYGGYELVNDTHLEHDGLLLHASTDQIIQTAHFVAFSGEMISLAATFLSNMLTRPAGSEEGGPMHVDGAYNWLRRAFPARNTLLSAQQLGYQRSSKTDIHQLRFFDRWIGLRTLVACVRYLWNMFKNRRNV